MKIIAKQLTPEIQRLTDEATWTSECIKMK